MSAPRPPLLRMGLGVLHQRATGRPRPINVMLSLMDRCSRRCDYCDIPSRGSAELSTTTLLGALREMAEAGVCRVGLWGGEPLLREDIGVLVSACKDLGLWTSMVSNGDLVRRRRDVVGQLDHLILSLDGERAAHDGQRGAGSHARVLGALETARELGVPTWTLTVLTRDNLQDVPATVERAARLGHKAAFQVLHHPPELDGGRGRALAPLPGALRRALKQLLELREAGAPVANSRAQLRELLQWPDLSSSAPLQDTSRLPCLAGQLFVNVDTDGRVSPCSLLAGDQELPRLQERGFTGAVKALGAPPCNRCTATAFTEYNALFRLRPQVIADWLRS